MAWNQGEGSSAGIEFDKGGGFGDFWGFNFEKEELDEFHECGKSNKGSDEITDLLPSDPFNMEGSTQGLTALTGWLEDFQKDFGFKVDENEVARFDSFLTGKMRIHEDARFQLIDGNRKLFGMNFREGLDGGHGRMDGKKEIMDFSDEKYWNLGDTTHNDQGGINNHGGMDGGNPSDALLLALGYLGLKDLLVVERVCKPLHDAVIGDPLLWRNINIYHPFCTKITNDILIKLTNRAQGHLHSLSLFHCSKLTDAGLKHVLDRNPNLSKVSCFSCVTCLA